MTTSSGVQRSFDVDLLQGVAGGSDSAIANVEIIGDGEALHWPELDADLLVHSLMQGIYGTKKWMDSCGGRNEADRQRFRAATG
ncbi:DUF2442 domain-containing protein [Romeria aff. gracilis LEGE 07310]|uniref:DUF2442 domain-containing protein n=1 Tax=Vasconcelosia minhoensis LEGE 07310 TaxID=915328 RepID=A0A8J7APP3_9CYAN|nr:DUF2442 domain-containing protein [Romeria aff. gracilis LEGE 07310]